MLQRAPLAKEAPGAGPWGQSPGDGGVTLNDPPSDAKTQALCVQSPN